MQIDPTAIVSKKANLADNVSIGPYSIVGDNISIGKGCAIGAHCVLDGYTKIGDACQIFTGAVVGSRPQDLKYKGEKSFLEIGNNNIIREYCTLNPATSEGAKTVIGDNNLFMAYAHIAHDCIVGNNCVFANNATLAGHVKVEDSVVIGGLSAAHQFVTLGELSIIGGCSKVVQDIPPFSTCDGHPARLYGLNIVGLKRHKVDPETIRRLNSAFKLLFESGLTLKHSLEKIENDIPQSKELARLLAFVKNSQRGISRSCRKHTQE